MPTLRKTFSLQQSQQIEKSNDLVTLRLSIDLSNFQASKVRKSGASSFENRTVEHRRFPVERRSARRGTPACRSPITICTAPSLCRQSAIWLWLSDQWELSSLRVRTIKGFVRSVASVSHFSASLVCLWRGEYLRNRTDFIF